MIKVFVLVEEDFLKGVHIVIIIIIEFWTYERFEICESFEQGRVPSPFFTADKSCDDELVVEDYWGVPFVHDVFYSSRLFLDKDALIELDIFLWVLWEEIPLQGKTS